MTRSERLRAAGFTPRDTRLACDECGGRYTPQMLPFHSCNRESEPAPVAADVVAEARTWLGTRWQHQAALKGVACDCAGLVLGVGRALGLAVPPAVAAYDRRPDGVMLQALCEAYLTRTAAAPAPGQVLLFRFADAPQHLGIVGNGPGYLTLIHAHAPDRRVVEHHLDATWRARVVAAYTLPGVAAWPA